VLTNSYLLYGGQFSSLGQTLTFFEYALGARGSWCEWASAPTTVDLDWTEGTSALCPVGNFITGLSVLDSGELADTDIHHLSQLSCARPAGSNPSAWGQCYNYPFDIKQSQMANG